MRTTLFRLGAAALALAASSLALAADTVPESSDDRAVFEKANSEWRQWRLQRLTSETGWVTLIGLDWLVPGENRLGSAPGSELPLPAGKAPARAGVLVLDGGKVSLRPEPGSGLTIAGAPVTAPVELATDQSEEPTLVELGSINFYVLKRGDRFGVRVRDREARLRREFPGLEYFPPDPALRLSARFTANPPGTTVMVANVLGMTEAAPSPGKVTVTLGGVDYTLTALDDTGDGRLFLIVGDKTNGRDTYGGGRFLYADPPKDGVTIVDFNRLYNPPCAFTPFSTCQLPPRENKLPVRLEVGEKKFAGAPHA
jgi:uncharacterized protein (DUF1684 family)